MKRTLRITSVLLTLLLGGCSSMDLQELARTRPTLDLFDYFDGQTRAWGVFQGRNGELKRQFVVDIQGVVDGDQLTLTEDFAYADGETSQRVWRIRREPGGSYTGSADDVIGSAQGRAYGSAFNWRYTLRLPYSGSSIDVKFDDWLFLQPDQVLLNRARVSKFGFAVGEVTLSFRKVD